MTKRLNRIEALDLARFIALIGIILNHTLQSETFEKIVQSMQDYHAVLFVILMGFFAPSTKNASTKKILIKGFVLIGVGFALGSASISIDVILVNLGLIFILGSFIVKYIQNIKALIILTSIWLVASPFISVILRRLFEDNFTPKSMNVGTLMIQHSPEQFFVHPFLYSHYPVLQWISFFFIGVILSRIIQNITDSQNSHDHQNSNILIFPVKNLLILGIIFFISSKTLSFFLGGSLWKMDNGFSNAYKWNDLWNSGAYTGTTLGMISSIGVSFIVISLCVLLVKAKESREHKSKKTIYITPYLSGATLSLYAIHAYSFTVVSPDFLKNDINNLVLLAATVVLLAMSAFVWYKLSRGFGFTKPGPLEEFTFYLTK